MAQTARQQRSAPRYGQSTHGRFARRGRMSSRPCVGFSSAGFTTVLAQRRLPLLSENLESRNRPSASRERVRRQAFSQIVHIFFQAVARIVPEHGYNLLRPAMRPHSTPGDGLRHSGVHTRLVRLTTLRLGPAEGSARVTSRNSDHCQADTTVSCNTGLRQGITASTIVPGWALATRNSPPNSFAR